MASRESDQLKELYESWVNAMTNDPDMELDEIRRMFGHWGDVTAEPGGVDYIEVDAGGIPAMWAIPKGCQEDRTYLCAHGGGCVVGSMYTHRKLFGHIAKATGCRALIVDYRLAPESPHPGPVNDMLTAYRWLLEQEKFQPEHIAFTGDSAGGALALTLIAAAREHDLPLPATSLPMSPWAGWDTSGATYDSNGDKDALVSKDTTNVMGSMFIGENGDPKHPLANPLYTDYSDFPPTYIQVGGHETLLDDSRRVTELLEKAGVEVKTDVFPEMQHVFEFLAGTAPEADEAVQRMADWARPRLGLSS